MAGTTNGGESAVLIFKIGADLQRTGSLNSWLLFLPYTVFTHGRVLLQLAHVLYYQETKEQCSKGKAKSGKTLLNSREKTGLMCHYNVIMMSPFLGAVLKCHYNVIMMSPSLGAVLKCHYNVIMMSPFLGAVLKCHYNVIMMSPSLGAVLKCHYNVIMMSPSLGAVLKCHYNVIMMSPSLGAVLKATSVGFGF